MACSLNMVVLSVPKLTSSQTYSSNATESYTNFSSPLSSPSNISRVSLSSNLTRRPSVSLLRNKSSSSIVVAAKSKPEPLRIMISGAPASGKGTQCELITKKYGLVHIAAGDLLRAEVAAGSENGKRAKEFMEKGQLVSDKIVVMMIKERLFRPDSQENGWLLDGYPRSSSQAMALEDFGIRPYLFILLDVPEEILVERVVGRRLDPVTGTIYHLSMLLRKLMRLLLGLLLGYIVLKELFSLSYQGLGTSPMV